MGETCHPDLDIQRAANGRLLVPSDAVDRRFRDLTPRQPISDELLRLRGLRVYAEITANDKALDCEVFSEPHV